MPPSNTPSYWTGRTIYLEANPWRVLRRLLKAEPKPLGFAELRPWQRRDKDLAMMARLVELGLIQEAGMKDNEPTYKLTAQGRDAAELGEVAYNPPAPSTSSKAKRKK